MWRIKRSGLYVEIANTFDNFVDEFLVWVVSEKSVPKDQLETKIKSTNTPLCRVMVECDKLREFAIELVQHPKRIEVAVLYYLLVDEYPKFIDGVIQLPKCPIPIAEKCFEYFYDNLVDNLSFRREYLPSYITDTKQNYRTEFGRNIMTCPYCDLKDIPFHADSSIDHFLTKSKVPLLAISSRNLVVACTACNDRLKHQTMIFPMIHPFLHQAADNIKLRFMLVCPPHSISIEVTAPNAFEKSRMDNYCNLFRLNEQYTARVNKILEERQDIRREVVNTYKEASTSIHLDVLRVSDILNKVITSRYLKRCKMKMLNEFTKLFIEFYEHLQIPIHRKRLLNFIIAESQCG